MKLEMLDLPHAIQSAPEPIGLVGPEANATACQRTTRSWRGLRSDAARLLVPSMNLVSQNLPTVLAGVILMAGLISARAAVQTITIPQGEIRYVTCQVTGTNSNDLSDSTFTSWIPVAFSDAISFDFINNCVSTGPAHTYFYDGMGWTEDFATSATVLWPRDEVAAIVAVAATSFTLTGTPLTTPVAKTLVPGCLYLLGSQVLGADTFDNITGHPATNYAGIEVYRPASGGLADLPGRPLGSGGFNLYYSNAGIWSPQFPTLTAGEAVFIRVNAFPPTIVYPIHAGACTFPSVTFFGIDCLGFNPSTDTIQFTGGGLSLPIVGTLVTAPNSLQVHANFNLATATPGALLDVTFIIGGVTTTVQNAFQVDPLTLSGVTPSQGGSGCASTTLTFVGSSICPNATVTLSNGGTSITGTTLAVHSEGTIITAMFDLTTATTLGFWNATIVNPDTSNFIGTNLFTVVPLVASQIAVQIYGTPKIGANKKRYFSVAYRNTGNCASATNVTIELTGIPSSVALADYTTAFSATPIPGGFRFILPSVAPSANYNYFSFTLLPILGPYPYNVTLTANSLSPYPDSASITIQAVASYDPNDKFGHWGVGANHYITGTETFPYEIHFENKPNASAPAQQVFVTDQLDTTKLDLDTFNLGQITFGNQTINPPPGLHNFTTDVLFDVDGNSATGDDVIIVRIVANLDTDPQSVNYGKFTCNYLSYDPLTGALPDDPFHGFLPPNLTPPNGEGSVHFTIQPKPGLADATMITNGATIVFDKNAPILTPVWSNKIDLSKPVSAVASLPLVSSSSHFRVAWSGTDAGSGIVAYDVWVSDNGGTATLWQTSTSSTSGLYSGTPGHTYAFHSVAHDAVGYVENPPGAPDATITVDPNVPYDVWAGLFPAFNLIDPGADLDDDRRTNWQEYAFGLNPTSGTSANPITLMPNKATGEFRYTRRTPALTELVYTVQTSTDLVLWTDDTLATAGQTISSITGEVQTIAVTLSDSPQTAPSLFVRVKAE